MMIRKATIWRWGWEMCVVAALIGSGIGCHPSGTSTGLVPVTTKPVKEQENKDQPGKQPKPDVGSLHPYGAAPVRA